MPNLIPDPGFELEQWDLLGDFGFAAFVSDVVLSGNRAMRLRLDLGFIGPPEVGICQSQPITVTDPGVPKDIEFWLRHDGSRVYWKMRVDHFPNGLYLPRFNIALINSTDITVNEWTKFNYTVTPNTNQDALYFAAQAISPPPVIDSIQWHLDDIVYAGDAVAVKLAELSVGQMDSILQAQLSAELALIDTDRADGIVMAVPPAANYYQRPKPVIESGTAHVEIFESAIEFEDLYTMQDAQRATYQIPITVRVTWFNRDGDTRQQMITRGRRYAAGVFNVINKNPRLGATDGSIKGAEIISVTPAWEDLGDDQDPSTFKGSITMSTVVTCEEVQ